MFKLSHSRLIFIGCLTMIFSIMLSSCTVYYKTSDIKKTFRASQKEVNKALGKIAKDHREKRGIYNQITPKIPDASVAPYPALSNQLIAMKRSLSQLKQTAKQLEQMKANFNRLVKGRKKIESGSSLWENFQTIKNEYDLQTGTFESQAATYNKSSNKFTELLNKHKISNIKVVEVRQKIETYLKDLDQSIQLISDELSKSQTNPDLDKKVLTKLEAIVTEIQAEKRTLTVLIKDFEEEVGEEPKIWSGPGMRSHSILSDMKLVGDRITGYGKDYNKLANSL